MSARDRLDEAIAADRERLGIRCCVCLGRHVVCTDHAVAPYVLEVDGARPMTVNKVADLHRQQWARHTKIARRVWAIIAAQSRVPRLDRVAITATPLHRDGRSPQDVGACAPEVKAAIDGLVDAGVLDDDDPTRVVRLTFTAPDICGRDGLRLTIEVAP